MGGISPEKLVPLYSTEGKVYFSLMRTTLPLSLGTLTLAVLLASCTPQAAPPQATDMSASSKAMAPEAMQQPDHILVKASDVSWVNAPAVLPAGAKIAVLEGDPSKTGPFALRLQFPANYKIPPHTHPADEHVTVISGTFARGMGPTFDETKLEELGPGGFAMMKTGAQHFAWSKDGAVVQLHGIGPWGLTYVNPADDPRNATK